MSGKAKKKIRISRFLKVLKQEGLAKVGDLHENSYDVVGAFPAIKLIRKIELKTELIDYLINGIQTESTGFMEKVVRDKECPVIVKTLYSLINRAGKGNKEALEFVFWDSKRKLKDVTDVVEREPVIVRLPSMQSNDYSVIEERQRKLKAEAPDKINEILISKGLKPVRLVN